MSMKIAIIIYISLFTYFLLKSRTEKQTFMTYVIGNRKMSSFFMAMNVFTSDMSSWLFMGLPGVFYLYGTSQVWIILGLIFGSYTSWTFLAPRISEYSTKTKSIFNLGTLLSHKAKTNKSTINILIAFITLFFFIIYISSGLVGVSKILTEAGFNYNNALYILTILLTIYVIMGGFSAIVLADVIQGMIIFLSLVLIPFVIFVKYGSIIMSVDFSQSLHLNPFAISFYDALAMVAWGLGYFGQPHIVSKYISLASADQARKSRNISTIWSLVSMIGAASVGVLASLAGYKGDNHELVLMYIVKDISLHILFPIIILATISASISTINGQIISLCSSLVNVKSGVSDKKLMLYTRISIAIVMMIAMIISTDQNATVLRLVEYAWSGFGASFGPVILYAMYVKYVKEKVIICSIIFGFLSVILVRMLNVCEHEMLPCFIVSSLFVYISNKLMQK